MHLLRPLLLHGSGICCRCRCGGHVWWQRGAARPLQGLLDALHLLHRQGLVAESGKRGFEVTQLDPQRIRELYEVRGAIDALAARLAARRVKEDSAARSQLEAALEAALATCTPQYSRKLAGGTSPVSSRSTKARKRRRYIEGGTAEMA